jgi:hypothetical protein
VRSPTAVALAVAGIVLLAYWALTGGAAIGFAVDGFVVAAYLLAPYARGGGGDGDDPPDDPPPAPVAPQPGATEARELTPGQFAARG